MATDDRNHQKATFSLEESASMAAGAIRGLLARSDVALQDVDRVRLQIVLRALHDALGMDPNGHSPALLAEAVVVFLDGQRRIIEVAGDINSPEIIYPMPRMAGEFGRSFARTDDQENGRPVFREQPSRSTAL